MESTIQEIARICAACGGSQSEPYAAKGKYLLRRCLGCGTVFVHPLPLPTDVAAVYGEDYFSGAHEGHGYVDYDADKGAMRPIFERHARHFAEIVGRPGALIDVGAATGFFMDIARQIGWTVSGSDVSAHAARAAAAKGLNVIAGTVRDMKAVPASIDCVTMWDVIEHMPDPEGDLAAARSLLRPGGLLAINTPDAGSLYARLMGSRWHLLVPPEHLWLFTRRGIAALLERNGFEVLEIGCIGKRFTLEYVVNMLYIWQKLAVWKRLAAWLRDRRLGTLAIRINLRDNMYVLARKR